MSATRQPRGAGAERCGAGDAIAVCDPRLARVPRGDADARAQADRLPRRAAADGRAPDAGARARLPRPQGADSRGRRAARGRSLALLDRLGTVPALRYGAERVQTNRRIARFLDARAARAAAVPADPQRRQAVEEAEAWGDEVFQMAARRLGLTGSLHGLDELARSRQLRPARRAAVAQRDACACSARAASRAVAFKANARGRAIELLRELPPLLDRIDAWIAAGVLDGAQLNAADFMIAPSLALIAYRLDLRAADRSAAVRRVRSSACCPSRRSPVRLGGDRLRRRRAGARPRPSARRAPVRGGSGRRRARRRRSSARWCCRAARPASPRRRRRAGPRAPLTRSCVVDDGVRVLAHAAGADGVVDRERRARDVRAQRLVAVAVGRVERLGAVRLHRRLRADVERQAQPGDHAAACRRRRCRRRCGSIGLAVGSFEAQAHRAAALRRSAGTARPTRRAPRGRACPRRRCAPARRGTGCRAPARRRRRARSRRPRRGSTRTARSASLRTPPAPPARARAAGSPARASSTRAASAAWSERFSPTAGWSSSTSISRIVRCSAGPTPESISSCGEL